MDAQYLFSSDILGYTDGHTPRAVKAFRDFRAEFTRMQTERVDAFHEFGLDVASGAYPDPDRHLVTIGGGELDRFREMLEMDDVEPGRVAGHRIADVTRTLFGLET